MARLAHSVSIALCNQENTQDIALDTLQSLVFIFQVRECVTKRSRARVPIGGHYVLLLISIRINLVELFK